MICRYFTALALAFILCALGIYFKMQFFAGWLGALQWLAITKQWKPQ